MVEHTKHIIIILISEFYKIVFINIELIDLSIKIVIHLFIMQMPKMYYYCTYCYKPRELYPTVHNLTSLCQGYTLEELYVLS